MIIAVAGTCADVVIGLHAAACALKLWRVLWWFIRIHIIQHAALSFCPCQHPIAQSWSIAIFAGAELIQFLGLGSNMDQGWAMNKAFCEAIGRPKLFATSLWTRTSTIHVIGNPKTMNHHNLTRTRIWSTYKKQVHIYIYIFLFFSCYHILPHRFGALSGSNTRIFPIVGKDDSVDGSAKPAPPKQSLQKKY